MEIRRRPSRHPRRSPSCLLVLAVFVAIGVATYVLRNPAEVREVFERPPTPTPTKSAAAYAFSCRLYTDDGETDNAIDACRSALQLDPNRVSFYLPLVELLVRDNQVDEALELASRAVELAPEDDTVWEAKAAAFLAAASRLRDIGRFPQDTYAEAIESGLAATKLNRDNFKAHAYLAGAYAALGPDFWEQARVSAETAYELAPDDPTVLYYYGEMFSSQGYYDAAREQLERAKAIDPNLVDAYTSLAGIYFFYAGERPLALNTVRDALEIEPDNAGLYDTLAYYNLVIGEYAVAQSLAEDALGIDPDLVRARAHLGHAFFKQFNYPSAIEQLDLATQGYQEPDAVTAFYWALLGLSHVRNAADAEQPAACDVAVPLYEQALAVAPIGSNGEVNAAAGMDECTIIRRQQAQTVEEQG